MPPTSQHLPCLFLPLHLLRVMACMAAPLTAITQPSTLIATIAQPLALITTIASRRRQVFCGFGGSSSRAGAEERQSSRGGVGGGRDGCDALLMPCDCTSCSVPAAAAAAAAAASAAAAAAAPSVCTHRHGLPHGSVVSFAPARANALFAFWFQRLFKLAPKPPSSRNPETTIIFSVSFPALSSTATTTLNPMHAM